MLLDPTMSGDHVAWKQRRLSYESFDQESLCVPIVRDPGVDQEEIKWAKSLLCRCSKVFFFQVGRICLMILLQLCIHLAQYITNVMQRSGGERSKPCEWKFTKTIKVAPEKLLSTKQLHSILAANAVLYSGQFVSDLMGVHSGKHMDSFISGQFSTDVPCNILAFWILCCADWHSGFTSGCTLLCLQSLLHQPQWCCYWTWGSPDCTTVSVDSNASWEIPVTWDCLEKQ